jgi:hypothetical protein
MITCLFGNLKVYNTLLKCKIFSGIAGLTFTFVGIFEDLKWLINDEL